QAKNARDVDQRADLWSAGILFYEMLTGRSAFPAPTEYARLAALLSVEPEPVERIDPGLAPLTAFFQRALKKDRSERFSSAVDMARALAVALPGLGGRPSGPPVPLSRLPDVPAIFAPDRRDERSARHRNGPAAGPDAGRNPQQPRRPRNRRGPGQRGLRHAEIVVWRDAPVERRASRPLARLAQERRGRRRRGRAHPGDFGLADRRPRPWRSCRRIPPRPGLRPDV